MDKHPPLGTLHPSLRDSFVPLSALKDKAGFDKVFDPARVAAFVQDVITDFQKQQKEAQL